MSLLSPAKYQVCLHYFTPAGLDFTVVSGCRAGERHRLHMFPKHVTQLAIALIRWEGRVADVSRHQVILAVGIKAKSALDTPFNTLLSIEPTKTLVPFESGVPTMAELKALPVSSFEELADAA